MHFEPILRSNIITAVKDLSNGGTEFATFRTSFCNRNHWILTNEGGFLLRDSMTPAKGGNAHLRRVLVESAWSYRYSPAVQRKMRERITGLSPEVQRIAWEAQNRLHKKFKSMIRKGKHKGAITVAITRELAGFVWAIAKEIDKGEQNVAA